MKISKQKIIKIIDEELSSVLNEQKTEEGLKKTLGALATAIVTSVIPAKASAHGNDEPTLRDTTTTIAQNNRIEFVEVSGHDNCYVSKNVVDSYYRDEIRRVFTEYESAKDEIVEYFSKDENLIKLIKLSSENSAMEFEDIVDHYKRSIKRNIRIGFSNLKFKIISQEEMRRDESRAEGVFFPGRNEIQVIMELSTRHSADIGSIIKHELHHAASEYANNVLHFYKDDSSYQNYSPGYQEVGNSYDRAHDEYLRHPWENSAYSYAARKLFNLSINPSKKDIIDGFKEYGINIKANSDGLYTIEVPTTQESSPGDSGTSLYFIMNKMKEKIEPYFGPKGTADISQTMSSIKPFIKKFEYDVENNKYKLIFDLSSYTEMLNKTAKVEKPTKDITVEKKKRNKK